MQHARVDYTATPISAGNEITALTDTLERLLARHQSALKAEGVDRQVEHLKQWLEDNRKDFSAGTLSEAAAAWLSDLCNNLKLAVEERQRLEDEGGPPATKEQAEQNEELYNAIRRIEKILHRNSTPQ